MSEVEALKERKKIWLKSIAKPVHQDVAQVEAILADLERKLNEILKNIAELRKMWETTKRKRSAHSSTRVNSSTATSTEDVQLPQIKDKASFDREEEKSDEHASADTNDSTRDPSVPNSSQENQNKRTSNEKILKRRESTFMMPTKQRTNRTRQKLANCKPKVCLQSS